VFSAGVVVGPWWGRLPLLLGLGLAGLTGTPVSRVWIQGGFPENRALADGSPMELDFVSPVQAGDHTSLAWTVHGLLSKIHAQTERSV